MDKQQTVRCGASIEGPKIGKHVVLWRKQCGNKTQHVSGRCHLHRGRYERSQQERNAR